MAVNHKIMRPLFAIGVGLFVAYSSYQWITNTERAARRTHEETVVQESRRVLLAYVADGSEIEISDALDRVRAAGKVYIYPTADGWEISGHYRRGDDSRWHSFLMTLDEDTRLLSLSVGDDDRDLQQKAATDPLFLVSTND